MEDQVFRGKGKGICNGDRLPNSELKDKPNFQGKGECRRVELTPSFSFGFMRRSAQGLRRKIQKM